MADGLKLADLTTAQRTAVTSLKRSVLDIADKFGVVRQKVADIAPRVMKLFKELQAAHDEIDFVQFVRLFNPDLPMHAGDKDGVQGYRKDKIYYAMTYMQRSLRVKRTGQQGRRDPATDSLARTLATVLQVVKDAEPIWQAVAREFGLQARGLAQLKARVEGSRPLVNLGIKPVAVSTDAIIHVEPVARVAQTAADNLQAMRGTLAGLSARGKRVKAA